MGLCWRDMLYCLIYFIMFVVVSQVSELPIIADSPPQPEIEPFLVR